MSAGGIGGQHGLIQPPVARLKGSIMLLMIFPRQHLQNFALSFFTCSSAGRSFVKILDTWPVADDALEAALLAASCALAHASIMKKKPKVKSSLDKKFMIAFP